MKCWNIQSEAIKIEPDFEVGEEASEEVNLIDFAEEPYYSKTKISFRIQEHDNTELYNK